jgi:two-component sensor histidine kinase
MGSGLELVAMHKDRREIPVEVSLSPIRVGREILIASSIRDISARKEAQRQLNTLVAELNHRVKNSLNIVQSIARRTVRQSTSLDEFKTAFESRIAALTELHQILSMDGFNRVTLIELVRLALKPHVDLTSINPETGGPAVTLNPSQAQSLCFILHELTSNAVKHGVFSPAGGSLKVNWQIAGPNSNELTLIWQEDTATAIVSNDERGFGIELIQQITEQELNGRCDFELGSAGACCKITFKFSP